MFKKGICVIRIKQASTNSNGPRLQSTRTQHMNQEKILIKNLLRDYSKIYRPVDTNSEKVLIYFGVFLIQLIDLVFFLLNC